MRYLKTKYKVFTMEELLNLLVPAAEVPDEAFDPKVMIESMPTRVRLTWFEEETNEQREHRVKVATEQVKKSLQALG